MKNPTRAAFNAFCAHLASMNGAEESSRSFAVEPSVQQNIETAIQESSAFLSTIPHVGVDEMTGEIIQLHSAGPSASRTNTDAKARQPRKPEGLTSRTYQLRKTNFDSFIKYATLDTWAKFPHFLQMVREVSIKQQALDRIMIGFNGTSAALDTDLTANPLLQDVNIGWLQHIRNEAQLQVKAGGNKVGGIGADFKNIDALVFDIYHTYIKPMYRNGTDIVALMGEGILLDKYFPLVNENQPTEKIAADMIISQKRVGNLQAVTVPYVPAGTILLTPLSNLAIYTQNDRRRMDIKDMPEHDEIRFFESSNEGYVVQDYNLVALIEGVTVEDAEEVTPPTGG